MSLIYHNEFISSARYVHKYINEAKSSCMRAKWVTVNAFHLLLYLYTEIFSYGFSIDISEQ